MEHQTAYRLRLLRTSVPACKSAHAGSIPASASIQKPRRFRSTGFFIGCDLRITSANFGIASASSPLKLWFG